MMQQNKLAKWFKGITLGIGICILFLYGWILPAYGQDLVMQYPEFSNRYWPWLIFLWITGIPCVIALILFWKISSNIGLDHSFSTENASLLKWISRLAAGDSVFFFLGNILLLLTDKSHPGIVLLSLIIVFIGMIITIISAGLSYFVGKAAKLQEENDLTI